MRLALVAALVGCGGASSRPRPTPSPIPAGDAAPASTTRPVATTITQDWQAQVLLERRDSLVLTLPDGSRQVQRIGRTAQFTLTLKSRTLSVRLDTLVLTPNAPAAAAGAIGTVWTGRVGAFGKLENLAPSKSGVLVEEMTNAVEALIPRLPRGGARAGDRWADTTERTIRVEVFRTKEDRRSEWRAHPATNRDGLRVVPIQLTERFEQIGSGSTGNRQMQMTAQGGRSGLYYVTQDGRVDFAVLTDTIAKLITVPASNQSIPTMQYSQTLIRYRPLPSTRPDD